MALKLEFVTVFSETEFLQRQAAGQLNSQLSYQEYLQSCEEGDALVRSQRAAMNPNDRKILEEREADFCNRQQKQPLAA
jgi:hypothetical protein